MLPYCYISRHFAYAKCAQIYLQDSVKLDYKMPDIEFDLYTKDGYFTIKRSYKHWSGIWSDMAIKTTSNRFFGTNLRYVRS